MAKAERAALFALSGIIHVQEEMYVAQEGDSFSCSGCAAEHTFILCKNIRRELESVSDESFCGNWIWVEDEQPRA